MLFPSPGWRRPFRAFWVACWNTIELCPSIPAKRIAPWLFGKALGAKWMRRVR